MAILAPKLVLKHQSKPFTTLVDGPLQTLPPTAPKKIENETVLLKLIYIYQNMNCSEVNPQSNLFSIFLCNGRKWLLLPSSECVSMRFCKLMNSSERKPEVNSRCDTKNSDE